MKTVAPAGLLPWYVNGAISYELILIFPIGIFLRDSIDPTLRNQYLLYILPKEALPII